MKTDANGNKQWDKEFGGKKDDVVYSVQQTRDGGYILAGNTRSYVAPGSDAWLFKTDTNGNELWRKTFGGTGDDSTSSVRQTRDGGFILAGSTDLYNMGKADAWLLKVSGDSGATPAAITPSITLTPTSTITPATPAIPALTPVHVPSMNATPKTPGFEWASAIAGMLAITFLMRKIH